MKSLNTKLSGKYEAPDEVWYYTKDNFVIYISYLAFVEHEIQGDTKLEQKM